MAVTGTPVLGVAIRSHRVESDLECSTTYEGTALWRLISLVLGLVSDSATVPLLSIGYVPTDSSTLRHRLGK